MRGHPAAENPKRLGILAKRTAPGEPTPRAAYGAVNIPLTTAHITCVKLVNWMLTHTKKRIIKMTEIVSIILGIISVFLGILALWQARKYKKLADSVTSDQDVILREVREMSTFFAVMLRNIDNEINNPSKVVLHKDELYVWKNRNYKPCDVSEIIDKIVAEFPGIMKEAYIEKIAAHLNRDDLFDKMIVVTLRHQYEKQDLAKIRILNEKFEKYGISLGLKLF